MMICYYYKNQRRVEIGTMIVGQAVIRTDSLFPITGHHPQDPASIEQIMIDQALCWLLI